MSFISNSATFKFLWKGIQTVKYWFRFWINFPRKNLLSKTKVDSHKKFLCYERKEKSNPFYLPKNWFYVREILVNVDACGKCKVWFLYLLPRDFHNIRSLWCWEVLLTALLCTRIHIISQVHGSYYLCWVSQVTI